MNHADTIVALSSGSLPSGVAVVRLSGPKVRELLTLWCGDVPPSRKLVLRHIGREETLDRGLVAFFPAPNSFTGEDCAEFQLHGSPAVVRSVLRGLSDHAEVRLAEAGEFTRRAFENGRLDLAQAQGLGDLVAAETDAQRRIAMARADGALSLKLNEWRERLLDLRAEIEAQLDFSDEGDVGALSQGFDRSVAALRFELLEAAGQHKQGRIVREGFRIVLAGPPNAGKSSLMNVLAKSDVAIVSDEPGTTRDLNIIALDLSGYLVLLIDSAGIRETSSKAEALGVAKAEAAMASADLVLWLAAPDAAQPPPRGHTPMLTVATKSDITRGVGDFVVSSHTGDGLESLMQELAQRCEAAAGGGATLLVSHERDRLALTEAASALAGIDDAADKLELAAEDLRRATATLERLLGRIDSEDVLGQLFSRFCIGK
jgi:tRNA modification GTPase